MAYDKDLRIRDAGIKASTPLDRLVGFGVADDTLHRCPFPGSPDERYVALSHLDLTGRIQATRLS